MPVAFKAAGTAISATTGTLTVAWPTHVGGDFGLLLVESSSGGVTESLATANGFIHVGNVGTNHTGTAGTKMSIYYCRATNSAMGSPVVTAGSDHKYGVILTFTGVIGYGDPWQTYTGGSKDTASTSLTLPSITTTEVDSLLLYLMAGDPDSTAAWVSSLTNSNLTNITERFDAGTTSGAGGKLAAYTATKATPGAVGTATASVTSSVNAYVVGALKAEPVSPTPVTSTFMQLAEGGTNGEAVTALNSGGASGTAFHSVVGTALTYSTDAPAHGVSGLKVINGGATAHYGRWDWTDGDVVSASFYYRRAATLTAALEIFKINAASNSTAVQINDNTSGRLAVFVSTGGGVTLVANAAPNLILANNTTYRIEFTMNRTTLAWSFGIYVGDATHPSFRDSGIASALAVPFGQARVGKLTTGNVNTAMYWDSIRISTDTSYPLGPFPIQNTFEGTHGADFTVTSTSIASESHPMAVNLGTGCTAKYSNAKGNAQSGGSTALELYGTQNQINRALFMMPSATTADRRSFRLWAWLPSAYAVADSQIYADQTSAAAQIAGVRISSTGGLDFRNAAGTVVLNSGAVTVPLDQWVFIQGAVTVATGTLELAFWSKDDLYTPLWSGSVTGQALGSTVGYRCQVNSNFGPSTAESYFYYDDFYATTGLITGFPGPRFMPTPIATIQNTFEGTNGTNFTTTSTDEAGETNASIVNIPNGSTATYSNAKGNAQAAGSTALALTGAEYEVCTAIFPFTSADTSLRRSFRFWVWAPSAYASVSTTNLYTDQTASGGTIGIVQLGFGGTLNFRDSTINTVLTSGATTIPLDQWVLIRGATTVSTGTLELEFYSATNLTTPVWSGSVTGQALGSTAGGRVALYTTTGNSPVATFYFDDLYATDGLSTGFPPPRLAPATVPYTETFTGTNGASWSSAWYPVVSTSGTALTMGSSTIQNNAGRLVTQATGFTGTRRELNLPSSTGNISVTGTVVGTSTGVEQYVGVYLNSDGTVASSGWSPLNGFGFFLNYKATAASSNVDIISRASGVTTSLGVQTKTLTGTTKYGFRVERLDTTLRARVWDAATSEPSTWDVTATVTEKTGHVALLAANGTTAVARTFDFDDLVITVPVPGGVVTYNTAQFMPFF